MPRKKNAQFAFRTSERDAISIRKKIIDSGQSQQDYLTNAALGAVIVNPECFRDLLAEYKRQGNNLNQITRQLNTTGSLDLTTEQPIREMNYERSMIWQLLKRCTQALASAQQ